jgi:hypothetical protein
MKIAKKRRTLVKTLTSGRRLPALLIGIAILVGASLWAWQYQSRKSVTPVNTEPRPASAKLDTTEDTKSSNSKIGESVPSGNPPPSGGSVVTPPADTPPKQPSGVFVNSHTLKLSDTAYSTCVTSSGAKCRIEFTKDGVTKTLQDTTADSDGAVYWSWKPQDIGLSEGTWSIKAVATLNGKSLGTDDGRNLEVQP